MVITGSISIASFATVIGAPVGMVSASLNLACLITKGIVKKTVKNNKKLDDTVNEYNDTYHRTIEMKPVAIKYNTYIDFKEQVTIKILNLKLVIK